jgi:general secretion pathway protein D
MKNSIKHFNVAVVVVLLFGGVPAIHAQQRPGGGGNGGGGFGGFGLFGGGGGFNNFNRNGGGSGSTSSAYNNNGTVGSATISMDPDTHNIVVIADEQTGNQISNVIANLDEPKPQVLIKVVFMEVELDNSLDLGVEGGWANSGTINQSAGTIMGLSGLNSVVTNFNALGQPLSSALSAGSSTSPLANGALYQIATSDFQATLRAVAAAGKAQILSRPSILALDGQLAQIVVGQQIYLPSGVSFTTVGTGSSSIPTINGSYQNVGIILDVTPYIGDNNVVEMIVQPQTSAVDTSSPGQVIATGGLLGTPIFAPNLDIRSADTVVVTPDAQPVVIGGLIGDTKSSSDTKVPILGDIPFLGNLFKYSTKSADKTELLIFLTPHIVQTPSQLVPLSVRERSQTPAINSSVSEKELDQYLERVPLKKNP